MHRGDRDVLRRLFARARRGQRRAHQTAPRRLRSAAAAAARQSADARDVASGGARARKALHRDLPGPARLRRLAEAAGHGRPRALRQEGDGEGHGGGDGAFRSCALPRRQPRPRRAGRASSRARLSRSRREAGGARHRADDRAFRARRHEVRPRLLPLVLVRPAASVSGEPDQCGARDLVQGPHLARRAVRRSLPSRGARRLPRRTRATRR